MKTKKSILAIVVLLALVFMQGQAVAGFMTGNELVENMRESDKADAGDRTANFMKSAYYSGYIMGVSDVLNHMLFDLPPRVTVGQICSVVAKYLKNHPERWNELASELVMDALSEAFPLKKK